jgi:hypothetical protein
LLPAGLRTPEQYVKTYAAVLEAATRSPDTLLPWRFLAVVRGGQFIGNYQLRPSIERGDVWHVQLGWWLAPEARGQGLGRASLAAALAHVHRDLGLRVARMGTGVDNVGRSVRSKQQERYRCARAITRCRTEAWSSPAGTTMRSPGQTVADHLALIIRVTHGVSPVVRCHVLARR